MSVTQALATYVAESDLDAIPRDVRNEAKRAILNYLGCALGGSGDPAVDTAIARWRRSPGVPSARVLGRAERLDPLHASLMNGISSHVEDFDDTTPQNYIHPSSPVASALFAYASANAVSGSDFVHAFVLGVEAESRVGNAVYPAHYDVGWHITSRRACSAPPPRSGSCAALDAADGLGARAGGDAGRRAARDVRVDGQGVSSRDARRRTAMRRRCWPRRVHGRRARLEGPRGFAAVQAATFDLAKVTAELGTDFNLRATPTSRFPAASSITRRSRRASSCTGSIRSTPGSIAPCALRVAPLVLDLCNQQNITKRTAGKVLRLSRRRGRPGAGKGGPAGIHRCGRQRSGGRSGCARGHGRRATHRSPRIRRASRWSSPTGACSAVGGAVARQHSSSAVGRQLNEKFRDQAVLALPAAQVEVALRCAGASPTS